MHGSDHAGYRYAAHGNGRPLCLPLAARAASAMPHEVTPVAPTLDSRFVDALPQRLMGGRAYDADPLDAGLAKLGIALIVPHRRNRKKPKT
jgi:hypothetical protein